MSNWLRPSYIFTPGAASVGTVNITGIPDIDLNNVVQINNVTHGTVIYSPGMSGNKGAASTSGSTITLETSTSNMRSDDVLEVFYNTNATSTWYTPTITFRPGPAGTSTVNITAGISGLDLNNVVQIYNATRDVVIYSPGQGSGKDAITTSGTTITLEMSTLNMSSTDTLQVLYNESVTGDISGSSGSVDNAVIRANGTGGATIQSASQVTIDDNGKLTIDISTEQGLEVISSLGAGAGQNLVLIETTNAAWDRPLLRINDVGTSGGSASIRLDSVNPDIEWVETDMVSPQGKFEQAVSNDIFQFNGRNAADNSFEQVMSYHREADGGMVGIGLTAGTVPNARLEVANPGTNSYFMLSPTVGAASGDVLDVDTNGNLVFNDRASAVTARFEGDTDANLFYINGPQDRVNIGMTSTQNGKLNVNGIIQSGISATSTGGLWISNSGGAGFAKVVATSSGSDYTLTLPAVTDTVETKHVSINEQTDSYTLVLTDDSKMIDMNKGTSNNLTVPLNATVAFPIGTQILVRQLGAGTTTIVATGGVTLQSLAGLVISGQYGIATLIKTATNTWAVTGALTT